MDLSGLSIHRYDNIFEHPDFETHLKTFLAMSPDMWPSISHTQLLASRPTLSPLASIFRAYLVSVKKDPDVPTNAPLERVALLWPSIISRAFQEETLSPILDTVLFAREEGGLQTTTYDTIPWGPKHTVPDWSALPSGPGPYLSHAAQLVAALRDPDPNTLLEHIARELDTRLDIALISLEHIEPHEEDRIFDAMFRAFFKTGHGGYMISRILELLRLNGTDLTNEQVENLVSLVDSHAPRPIFPEDLRHSPRIVNHPRLWPIFRQLPLHRLLSTPALSPEHFLESILCISALPPQEHDTLWYNAAHGALPDRWAAVDVQLVGRALAKIKDQETRGLLVKVIHHCRRPVSISSY